MNGCLALSQNVNNSGSSSAVSGDVAPPSSAWKMVLLKPL